MATFTASLVSDFETIVTVSPSNPLFRLVDRAEEAANQAARARLVIVNVTEMVTKIRFNKEGVIEFSGGGVPVSYRQPAQSSVVMIAWWTAPDQKIHIRVSGARVKAPKSPHGRRGATLLNRHTKELTPLELVYPELAVERFSEAALKARPDKEFLVHLYENPTDIVSRMAYADWLSEHGGDEATTAAALQAVETLRRITA